MQVMDRSTALARTALGHKGHSAERRETITSWLK